MDVINSTGKTEEKLWFFLTKNQLPLDNLLLYRRAFTHRSYINEHNDAVEDNERLEFLGDAILDFLVAAWIYQNFPEMKEGEMTRLRSALVKTDQLAEFATSLNLGELMYLGHGEAEGGGRTRSGLLCATFEALVGAIFLQSEIQAVQKFIEPMIKNTAEEIILHRKDRDPKSILQETIQAKGLKSPEYKTVSTSGPEHGKIFVVHVIIGDELLGTGEGSSKQLAAKAAAKDALSNLDSKFYSGN
jgi:ribonuclease-3